MAILTDQFKSMTEAQKAFVLNMLMERVFQSPKDFGLNSDGVLRIGQTLNFSPLFKDVPKIEAIFDKAKQTITPGSTKERLILKNKEKAVAWIAAHPNTPLTNDKVAEILNYKPKEATLSDLTDPKPAEQPKESIARPEAPEKPQNQEQGSLTKLPEDAGEEKYVAAGAEMGGGSLSELDQEYVRRRDEEQTRRDIAQATGRLSQLEKEQEKNPNIERSLRSDMEQLKSQQKGSETDQELEKALANDVNKFFAEGLFGKTPGIESKRWNFIKGLPFSKLVKYYTVDSNKSGLSPEAMVELKKSDKYRKFFEYVSWLKGQTDGAVILFEDNASIEQVLRKTGEYLLKRHKAQLKPAA